MLETLNRDTATLTPLFDALQRVDVPAQQHVVVHRPGSPRPALRVAPLTSRPMTPPPSERHADLRVDPREYVPPTRLRLTRRGRLTLLVATITLLFTAFSVGRVMSNAAGAGSTGAATHTVVVAPGDTAWSIAHDAMPGLDGRDAVDRLLAMNHSDGNIRVGQTLQVPGS